MVEKFVFFETKEEIVCSTQTLRVLGTAKAVASLGFQRWKTIPWLFHTTSPFEGVLKQMFTLSSCVTWAMCSEYYGVMCSPLWVIHKISLSCAKQVTVCEGSPRFWLTYVWNKSFVVICFLTEELEIVCSLELTWCCSDSAFKVSGVLACGLLMQNKSKDGFKVHFLK